MIRKNRAGFFKSIKIILILAAIALILMVARFNGGSLGIFNRIAETIAYPFEKASAVLYEQYSGARRYIADIYYVYDKNAELRQENAELKSKLNNYIETENENQRLRKLLEASKIYGFKKVVAANVIAFDLQPLSNSLIVDMGNDYGIKSNMPVVTADGLVGVVTDVYAYSARIKLITSPDMSFSATVQRFDARTFAMAQGNGYALPVKLENIPQNVDVIKGDRVVTNGLGGLFPKGLLVGEVIEVKDSSGYLRTALIKPAVNVYTLEQVLIVTDFVPPRLK